MPFKCKWCDVETMIEMREPVGGGKAFAVNTDGSVHKHNKHAGSSQQPGQTTISDTPAVQEAKITANLRSEAIAKAHEENIESNEKLRGQIDKLSNNIDDLSNQVYNVTKQLSAFNDIVRAYLETLNKE